MTLLEKYLQEQNEHESFGIVADLSMEELDNMPVISYPDELLQAIGVGVGKDPSVVLYELLARKQPESVISIQSREELTEAVRERTPFIFIPAAIREAESELVHSVMAEKDTLGVELGSAGTANLLAEVIYRFQMMFDKNSKEFKELKSKLRRYHVRIQDQSGHLIYEKEQLV